VPSSAPSCASRRRHAKGKVSTHWRRSTWGNRELYAQLCDAGFVPREDGALAPEHLETVRVAHTLVHELEVNWAGVEVVLHMRTQLVPTRRQVGELAEIVRRAERERSERR
jgi:hypothetical protein